MAGAPVSLDFCVWVGRKPLKLCSNSSTACAVNLSKCPSNFVSVRRAMPISVLALALTLLRMIDERGGGGGGGSGICSGSGSAGNSGAGACSGSGSWVDPGFGEGLLPGARWVANVVVCRREPLCFV